MKDGAEHYGLIICLFPNFLRLKLCYYNILLYLRRLNCLTADFNVVTNGRDISKEIDNLIPKLIMTNKVQNPENDLMVETKGKLEIFFDKYGDKLLKAVIGIAIAAVVVFLAVSVIKSSTQKNEQAAQAALTVALTTDAGVEAYEAIVAEFDGTAAANTASYVAGAELLKAGDIEAAKAMLAKYEDGKGTAAEVINGLVYTLRGDIAVEENDLQSAADLYTKALAASADVQTWETNSTKLALVYIAMGDVAKSQETYKALVARFPELKQKYTKYIAE